MAIQVMIKRKVRQGHQARILVPLILQMRALAMKEPGYIFSETWCDLEYPGECIVVSRWRSLEDWNQWWNNEKRILIDRKINALTEVETQYRIYAPLTVEMDNEFGVESETCITR